MATAAKGPLLSKTPVRDRSAETSDRQITFAPRGHLLTNAAVWSPNGRLVVYDTRSDPAGAIFDSCSVETVDVDTGRIRVAYSAGPCGVATFDPNADRIVFIRGPIDPTAGWSYSPTHREGLLVELSRPEIAVNLDARNLVPPFTPGALRGGSHVHQFSPDGQLVSFTYEDAVLEVQPSTPDVDRNSRMVGVTVLGKPVDVPPGPHNLPGVGFSVVVTALIDQPTAGSDDISRAREESWIGTDGYVRPDGTRQGRALSFLGTVIGDHSGLDEIFVADLPDDLTLAGRRPIEGSPTRRPAPPAGVAQRRVTFTQDRKFPGVAGPRHWPRSTPDGSAIAFVLRDDAGVSQLFSVSPNGGPVSQITRGSEPVASAFTWHPDGRRIACVMDRSVVTIDVPTGRIDRLTARFSIEGAPRPEACVFSPDGSRIAYVRRVPMTGGLFNQIFVVTVPTKV